MYMIHSLFGAELPGVKYSHVLVGMDVAGGPGAS
jgi:hypothetical protein